MSSSKVEMSLEQENLDEIIKANKSKSNTWSENNKNKRRNANRKNLANKKFRGVQKRGKINKFRQNQKNFTKSIPKNKKQITNAAATKKLVQKLVKKALAQQGVSILPTKQTSIFNNRKLNTRLIKRPILNRLNQKNRVFNQQVVKTPITRIRAPIYQNSRINLLNNLQKSRRNFSTQRNVIINNQPAINYQKRFQKPVYQLMPVQKNSVRAQINALRRQFIYVNPQQKRPQVQKRTPQITFVKNTQKPRRSQQQRKRFVNKRRQMNPFNEPENFLQRIPSKQNNGRKNF